MTRTTRHLSSRLKPPGHMLSVQVPGEGQPVWPGIRWLHFRCPPLLPTTRSKYSSGEKQRSGRIRAVQSQHQEVLKGPHPRKSWPLIPAAETTCLPRAASPAWSWDRAGRASLVSRGDKLPRRAPRLGQAQGRREGPPAERPDGAAMQGGAEPQGPGAEPMVDPARWRPAVPTPGFPLPWGCVSAAFKWLISVQTSCGEFHSDKQV